MDKIDFEYFTKQMKRLRGAFPNFKQERQDLLWPYLKNNLQDEIRRAVNYFIGESRHTPTVNDFLDFFNSKGITSEEKKACEGCGFTGFRHRKALKKGIADYAFRCNCDLGQSLSEEIPNFFIGEYS